MSDLVFAAKKRDSVVSGSWRILVVDDDPGIHAITKTVLRDMVYDNRSLEFISAYSRNEAEDIYRKTDGVSLILLDVVMEEEDSGLKFVEFIRNEMNDSRVRIILRTGQPGKAPSQRVIIDYDINDYEEKTDLTAQKLYTSVIASLRNFRDLEALEAKRSSLSRHQAGLSRITEASGALFGARDSELFAMDTHDELIGLLGIENGSSESFVAVQVGSGFRIITGYGSFADHLGKDPKEVIGENSMEALRALKREGRNLIIRDGLIQLYEDARQFRLLIHVSGIRRIEVQDHQVLDIFSSNVGVAFENLRLRKEIVGTQEDLITRLGQVVETRAHDTAQHVRRVGEFCEMLGRCAGLSSEAAHELKMASAMHDIGKIGIPDEILLKPDVLTDQEFEVVRTHATIGWKLLKDSTRPLLRIAAEICLDHHERMDGSGYPNGLKGDEISLNGRIVAICDVFDSLTHGRLGRDAWSVDEAVAYLEKEKGTAFDSVLVDYFISFLDDVVAVLDEYQN